MSPEDAAIVEAGGDLAESFFPQGYVSLVSDKFSYLLGEFVGRLDADDNLLGLLGGRFDRNQVGGER